MKKKIMTWKVFGKAVLGFLIVTAIATYVAFQTPPFGGAFEGDRLARMQASPQYQGDRFENTPPQDRDMHVWESIQKYSEGQIRYPQFKVPVEWIKPEDITQSPKNELRAYWFGHASVLLEIDGMKVMTDPVFSEYVSPFQVPLAPGRMHSVPLELEQMPKIDAVVISHDHFDHLDMATMRHFASQGTHFYVGLGIGAHLERWNVTAEQIHEMDWWQSLKLGSLEIHCTPARHYSGRKKMDNSTLWSSWYVKGPKHSFYYSGDTGYAPHFAETKKRLGTPDLSVMKVGAYGSTWLDIHMDPESAVRAHQDLGAKLMFPVHWGTFNLGYHAWEEPMVRTVEAAKKKGIRLVTPRVGERVTFGRPFQNSSWYLGK